MSKNSSKKLALCLSGQPRSYFKAYQFIKRNLLDVEDVDVFIHTWRPKNDMLRMKVYEELSFIYDPKLYVMEPELPENINSDLSVPNGSHPPNFCTSMFYSIYRSNNLRIQYEMQSKKKYDYVIRCRFDLALNKHLCFETFENNKIYVSKDVEGPSLLNDQFAISDPDTMNVYSSTFLFLRKLYENGTQLCGHAMLEKNLENFSVKVEKIDINHPFVDGKYNIGRHSIVRDDMSEWVDPKLWGY